jgi:hypothetical protein
MFTSLVHPKGIIGMKNLILLERSNYYYYSQLYLYLSRSKSVDFFLMLVGWD